MMAIGLDIGGANLKISDGTTSLSVPFALWRSPELLAAKLQETLRTFDPDLPLAVTMTGELADCFVTRDEGVQRILDAVAESAEGRLIGVWQTSGEFVPMDIAREFPTLTAAANWHALATWAGRIAPQGRTLLIDIGSTTTDIIPIEQGIPLPTGRTDTERLVSSELVYLGVRRTPVCGLTPDIELRGARIPLAKELFATTLDVGLLSGRIQADSQSCDTANGRPATIDGAWDRLSRMICSDRNELSLQETQDIADQLLTAMVSQVADGISAVLGRGTTLPEMVILSGEGEWLAELCLQQVLPSNIPKTSLRSLLGVPHSGSACAFALSRLLSELLSQLSRTDNF